MTTSELSKPSAAPFAPIVGVSRPPEPLSWVVARWAARATVVGAGLSVVGHLLFLMVAWAISVGQAPAQAGNVPEGVGGVQMAVMSAEQFGSLQEAAIDTLTPAVADAPPTDLPGVNLMDTPGGGGLSDSGELGTVGTGMGGAGSGEGIGVGDGSGGSGGGGASFFGVEARGSRFAYVCDISGSMQNAGKLGALKRELISSIDGLLENAEFMVYFFESEAIPLGKRERWLDAVSKNKQWAIGEVQKAGAQGGTNPLPAFVLALSLRPRPDAIYFMTDGLFDAEVVDRVAAMNASGKKVPVHCIAFGDQSSEPLMQKIAKDSGGSYTFVPLTTGRPK
jgi:hypothetical protein